MKLILYINDQVIKEQKLHPPAYDKYLIFSHNYDVRFEYVKKMIAAFKLKNQDKLVGKWKIILQAPSKMNIERVNMTKEFVEKFQIFN